MLAPANTGVKLASYLALFQVYGRYRFDCAKVVSTSCCFRRNSISM